MAGRILIDAVAINRGGGKILLDYLIRNIDKTQNIVYLLDKRILNNHPEVGINKIIYIKHNFYSRCRFYLMNNNNFDKVICLANFPPPIKLSSEVYTFFQNVAIFDRVIYTGIKWVLQRIIIKVFKNNTDKWIVQTNSVKALLESNFKTQDNIYVYPFFASIKNETVEDKSQKSKSIIYVSDGDPHKNHQRLFHAFKYFQTTNPDFELIVTISQNYPRLLELIYTYNQQGVSIKNVGFVSQMELNKLYQTSLFCVYPSTMESFGLGLIEAAQNGLPIVASDLDFVYDVIQPSATFNPFSVDEIFEVLLDFKSYIGSSSKVVVKNKLDLFLELLN